MRFEHSESDKLRLLLTNYLNEFMVIIAFDEAGNCFDWFLDTEQTEKLLAKIRSAADGSRQTFEEAFAGDDELGPAQMQLNFVRRGDYGLDIYGSDDSGSFATELTLPEAEWNSLIAGLEYFVTGKVVPISFGSNDLLFRPRDFDLID